MKRASKKRSRAFETLTSGLEDALEYHRGARVLTVRDVALQRPPPRLGAKDVARVRARLKVSQAVFARLLNVSPRTVQAWEASARVPSDAALKLLDVAKRHPEVLFD